MIGAANMEQIHTAPRPFGLQAGESSRTVSIEKDPMRPRWRIVINGKPLTGWGSYESTLQLAKTQGYSDPDPRTIPVGFGNSVVRSHTRIGPHGRPVQVKQFFREDSTRHHASVPVAQRGAPGAPAPAPATKASGDKASIAADEIERLILHHDRERFATKDPDKFRAHTASLNAFSASDKAEEHKDESWHEAASKAHSEAAELWEIVGASQHAKRHRNTASFHAAKARSAANAEPMLAANCIECIGPAVKF